LNSIGIVAIEADCWYPTDTEAGSPQAAHRFNVFGNQGTVLNELIELLAAQDGTPLSMVAVLPPAFEVVILELVVVFGLIPEIFGVWRCELFDVHVVRRIDGINNAELHERLSGKSGM
tara:strand:- start:36901 stop:37254 length:354 start_codon:yes stop_codon:yes gene_type:complete